MTVWKQNQDRQCNGNYSAIRCILKICGVMQYTSQEGLSHFVSTFSVSEENWRWLHMRGFQPFKPPHLPLKNRKIFCFCKTCYFVKIVPLCACIAKSWGMREIGASSTARSPISSYPVQWSKGFSAGWVLSIRTSSFEESLALFSRFKLTKCGPGTGQTPHSHNNFHGSFLP